MKKALLIIAIVAMLACVFAVSVSAATTETIGGITYYLNNGKASVTNANKSCTLETVTIPDVVVGADGKEYKVTTINQQAFDGNTNVKYISLSRNITTINAAAFRGMTNLVFVDFNDNPNEISMPSFGVFRGCTKLKALCLPDGIKALPDQFATNCKSLTAVYLPTSLETMKGNQDGGPAFGGADKNNICASLFFVNEKFSVRDENGNFYTAETFPVPEKPNVYYFPSNLKAITGAHNPNNNLIDETGMIFKSGGNSDCAIQYCSGLNSVLVLSENYIGYKDVETSKANAILDENQRGDTLTEGLFRACGNANNPLTVVFMGKIHRVSFDRKDGYSKYTTYVFANPDNTGFEDTLIGTWYNTSDTNYSNQDEMYVIFCHANNGAGAKYKINFVGSADDNKYPVLVSTLQADAATHMANPNATPYDSEATCTRDKMTGIVDCFCGNPYSYETIVENSKLGHDTSVENGAVDFGIAYTDYMASGVHSFSCARCNGGVKTVVEALFIDYGYSATEAPINGTYAMSQFYGINRAAIEQYREVNADFAFGFVVAADATPFASVENGTLAPNKIFVTEEKFFDYDYVTVSVSGIDTENAGKAVAFCMFVKDGESIYYLDGGATVEKVSVKSYNDILAIVG